MKIFCPKCQWVPRATDRWRCEPACGCIWNIFDNDGRLDEDDPLTDEEKAPLEARLEDMEKHPEKSIPWKEAEARLKARFGE